MHNNFDDRQIEGFYRDLSLIVLHRLTGGLLTHLLDTDLCPDLYILIV